MEVQEKHARLGSRRPRDDSARNVRVETYFEAIDHLVGRGYTVVRIGDATMAPVSRPGVVDLASLPTPAQALEILCLLRSRFLMCSEAGPVGVAYLTDTPTLTVNATDPVSSFPVRAHGLYLLKRVVEVESGRRLSVSDLLTVDYLEHVRNTRRHRYLDNTSGVTP